MAKVAHISRQRKHIERLLITLKQSIETCFRAHEDDDEPSMMVTVSTSKNGMEWVYQTGDNSYTGACYGHPYWAVVALYRNSSCRDLASQIVNELLDQIEANTPQEVKHEEAPAYLRLPQFDPSAPVPIPAPKPAPAWPTDDQIVEKAMSVLLSRLRLPGAFKFGNPEDVKNYLRLKVAPLEHEVFGVLLLDNQHALIEEKILFYGTIDGASVYPREVVKAALLKNAAAVMFYHNHPSGVAEPSQADQRLTQRLSTALSTVDIRTLDHFIVAGKPVDGTQLIEVVSFAERGLI